MPRITELFAFVVADTGPDDEGIIGTNTLTQGWMPFIGADMDRMRSLRPIAATIGQQLRKDVRILRFAGPPEVIETIEYLILPDDKP